MSIDTKIQEASEQFTQTVTAALREHMLEALEQFEGAQAKTNGAPEKTNGKAPKADAAPAATPKAKKSKSGRLARRSPEQIAASVAKIQKLLAKKPAGLRSEQIRTELGLEPKEMPRILQQGIASKSLKILSGEKRSTTYAVGRKG